MTTNPILIALINMTIVFAVLGSLGVVIGIIRMIDPTQKKTTPASPKVEAPAPAPAVEAAVEDDSQLVAVIAAAVSAYGYGASQIASIRRIADGKSWAQAARVEAVTVRNQMF